MDGIYRQTNLPKDRAIILKGSRSLRPTLLPRLPSDLAVFSGERRSRAILVQGGQLDNALSALMCRRAELIIGKIRAHQARTRNIDTGANILQDPGIVEGKHSDRGLAGVVSLVVDREEGRVTNGRLG